MPVQPLEIDSSGVVAEDVDREASRVSFKSKLLGLCQIRSTPHKAVGMRLQISDNPHVNKWLSPALALLLVLVAVIFGEFVNIVQYLNVDTDTSLCKAVNNSTAHYLAEYRNLTKHTLALEMSKRANLTDKWYWKKAYAVYKDVGNGWDYPYETDSDEVRELSDCSYPKKKKKCKYTKTRWTCKKVKVTVPCAMEIDMSGLYTGGEWDYLDTNLSANGTAVVSAKMAKFIDELFFRVNMVSSCYCIWVASLIFIGPPFAITSPNMKIKTQQMIAVVSKVQFVVVVLFLWFLLEFMGRFFQLYVIDSDLWFLFKFMQVDPCFADETFLVDLYTGAADICSDINIAEDVYGTARTNMDYYYAVEQTYRYQTEYANVYTGDGNHLLKIRGIYWPDATCSMETFLESIEPVNARMNVAQFLLGSGAISGIFLQPILANLIIFLFQIAYPLCAYNGRALLPYGNLEVDKKRLLREVNSFIRCNTVFPLLVHIVLLSLIAANINDDLWVIKR